MLRVLRLQCRGRRHGHLVAEGRSKSHALSLLLLILLRCYLARQVDELKMDRLMDKAIQAQPSSPLSLVLRQVILVHAATCCLKGEASMHPSIHEQPAR